MSQMFRSLNVTGIDPNAAIAAMSQPRGGGYGRPATPPSPQETEPDPRAVEAQLLNRQYETATTSASQRLTMKLENLEARRVALRDRYKQEMASVTTDRQRETAREMAKVAQEKHQIEVQLQKLSTLEMAQSGFLSDEAGGQLINDFMTNIVDGTTSQLSAMRGSLLAALDDFNLKTGKTQELRGADPEVNLGEDIEGPGGMRGRRVTLTDQKPEAVDVGYWELRGREGFVPVSKYGKIADVIAVNAGAESASQYLTDFMEALDSASEMEGQDRQQMLQKAAEAYKAAVDEGANPMVVGAGLYELQQQALGQGTVTEGAAGQLSMEQGVNAQAGGDKKRLAEVLGLVPAIDADDGTDLVKSFSPSMLVESYTGVPKTELQQGLIEVLATMAEMGVDEFAQAMVGGDVVLDEVASANAFIEGMHPSARKAVRDLITKTIPGQYKLRTAGARKSLNEKLPTDRNQLESRRAELEALAAELELGGGEDDQEILDAILSERLAAEEALDQERLDLQGETRNRLDRMDEIYVDLMRGLLR